jgi:hypothetical protein
MRVAWLGVLALAGCYTPYEPACGFTCGSGGACPDGYTCQADHVCHKAGTNVACSNGPGEFDVLGAQSLTTLSIAITFSDPPNPAQAQDLANYTFAPGLELSGSSTVAGATVTLGTMPQQGLTYTLTAANITRLGDALPLRMTTATFAGRTPFDVASATSAGVHSVVVTFDAAPDATQATTLANYAIADALGNPLALSGTPQLAGNAVTLATDTQSAVVYDLDVFNITRASDHEPLEVTGVTFTGSDHCSDGTTDGDETDVDCGGATCSARCATGKACTTGTDCASGTCVASVCS